MRRFLERLTSPHVTVRYSRNYGGFIGDTLEDRKILKQFGIRHTIPESNLDTILGRVSSFGYWIEVIDSRLEDTE